MQNPLANFEEVTEHFKYSPIDPEAEQRIQLTCEQWQSMERGLGRKLIMADVNETKQDEERKKKSMIIN